MNLATYPYTATRVKAMKSILLTRGDYLKMSKMGLSEMIRFLEEREYKNEIDHLSREYNGIELINLALNVNLSNTINKLLRISNSELAELIRSYSMKWVINNIKVLVRSKDWTLLKKAIVPIEPTTYEYCKSLMEMAPEKFTREVSSIIGASHRLLHELHASSDTISFENELDKAYNRRMGLLRTNIQTHSIKVFYVTITELLDIRNIVKLKLIGTEEDMIKQLIITRSKFVESLVPGTLDDTLRIIGESKYKRLTEGAQENISEFENNIERHLFSYSFRLLHQQPLSAAPIFGYLLAKEIEIRNIKLLLNARAVNLEEEFIERNLITEDIK